MIAAVRTALPALLLWSVLPAPPALLLSSALPALPQSAQCAQRHHPVPMQLEHQVHTYTYLDYFNIPGTMIFSNILLLVFVAQALSAM